MVDEIVCPECGSKRLVFDQERGEVYCKNCGTVIEEDILDLGKEWRNFYEDKSKPGRLERTGPKINGKILPTEISFRDSNGRPLKAKTNNQFYRLRKLQNQVNEYIYPSKRSNYIMEKLNEIFYSISSMNGVSISKEIKTEVQRLVRESKDNGEFYGLNNKYLDLYLYGWIYAILQVHGIPISLKELVSIYKNKKPDGIKHANKIKKFIGRGSKMALRYLKEKGLEPFIYTSAEDYLRKYSEKLNVDNKTREMAENILKKYRERRPDSGIDPSILAAASLYFAGKITGNKIKRVEAAKVAKVACSSIRNSYNRLKEEIKNITLL